MGRGCEGAASFSVGVGTAVGLLREYLGADAAGSAAEIDGRREASDHPSQRAARQIAGCKSETGADRLAERARATSAAVTL